MTLLLVVMIVLRTQVTVRGKALFPTPKKVVVSAGPTSALYSVATGEGLEGARLSGTPHPYGPVEGSYLRLIDCGITQL